MCDFRTPEEVLKSLGNVTIIYKGEYRTPIDLHGPGLYYIVGSGSYYSYYDGKRFHNLASLDNNDLYDVEASGGPPDPTAPPGTVDYTISKLIKFMEDKLNEL